MDTGSDMKDSFLALVASVSRAVGNDLRTYTVDVALNKYELVFREDISQEDRPALLRLAKHYVYFGKITMKANRLTVVVPAKT